ncbi:quinolone resistance protein [Thermococcus chitonophagus]|uniref:Multidrug and toxin extrusion (MATE) family efflux pump YdhE/NorM, homolog n=1 Tax=Thermococcus chitonophagus TaxID=54262 RepID=A0A160VQY0_9EURY|nr:MFS transporter [Thermococcus chitonophagus]ASJ15898.1 quinolone resistance protein [Thermococcus chitonophagus]CUX77140.1 Multidrug and toxin extrusion (MATE) family efflux pump YdhE/NorM, homolog [Thermococcus chitonophagus]
MGSFKYLWFLNFSTFFFFLGISLLNPLISPYAITLGAQPFLVGLVAGVASGVSLVSKLFGGYVGDKGYRFHAMFLGNVLGIVAGFLYIFSGLSGSITVFAVGRAIHGFAMGIFFPSSLSSAVDLAPRGRVGEALGWRGMMFSLGNIVGPAIGGFVSDKFGFTFAFALTISFSILGALFVLFVWREIGEIHIDKHEENVGYRKLLRPFFVSASLALFFISMAYSGVVTFLPALYKVSGLGQSVFGFYMMLMGFSSFLTRIVGGKSADKIGPIPVARFGIFIIFLGYLSLLKFKFPPYSYVPAVVSGLGFGLSLPALQFMALARLPQKIRTMGSSIYTMFFDLGMLSGQVVLGYVAQLRGYEGVFPVIAFLPLISIILVNVPLLWRDKNEG